MKSLSLRETIGRHSKVLLFLFILSLTIRLSLFFTSHFDGLYGQDSFAYFRFAAELKNAVLEFRIPGHFNWPLGYPGFISLAFIFGHGSPESALFVNILCGTLIPVFIYLLTFELFTLQNKEENAARQIALVAGLLAAVSGQLLVSSLVIMADVPALMWSVLSAWLLIRYCRCGKLSFLLLAVSTLVLAIITRWVYGLLVLPWILLLFIGGRQRLKLSHFGFAVLLFILLSSPQILYTIVNPKPFVQHQWIQEWNFLNAFKATFHNSDGDFHYRFPVFLFYGFPALHPFYVFPFFFPFFVFGIWRALKEFTAYTNIFLFGWFLSVYVFLIGMPYESLRFPMALFPPILILIATGMVHLWIKSPRKLLLYSFVIVGCIFTLIWGVRGFEELVARKNRDLYTVDWVKRRIPEPALLYTFNITQMFNYYSNYKICDLYVNDPVNQELPESKEFYLLADVRNLEQQWKNRKPLENYRWLKTRFVLQKLGTIDHYTLFSVLP